ncbi:MAG TPA: HD domain-containing protein [Alkalispirochaeta sp.]|nr:HD domain-containing protein [Alkalispirochaeta sp.]
MNSPEIAQHLEMDYTDPIRDPLWSHIYLSPAMMRLTNTAEFQQLSRIKQLGPTFLVYPGATHTRLNHSLGVFHIARRIMSRLVRHPETPSLTLPGVKAFLAASLLHDVGHFPYTHSFKSLPLAEHEHLTGRYVQHGELARHIRDDLRVDPAMVAAIVDESLPAQGNDEIRLYRSLLSGSLDPDKLDYLNRDAYFCGVPYGLQDIDFALSRLVPVGYEGLGLEESGVSAVENILFSKYLMYRAVYWHRTVRVATAMIKKSIHQGLQDDVIQPEELYGLDDELFFSRFAGHPYPPFELISQVAARRLLKPAADIAYDATNPGHAKLTQIAARHALEAALAQELRIPDYQVIIDLPDPVSFEAHFPIFVDGEPHEFAEKSVFSTDVVARFTETIRRIRLMIPHTVSDALPDPRATLEAAIADVV